MVDHEIPAGASLPSGTPERAVPRSTHKIVCASQMADASGNRQPCNCAPGTCQGCKHPWDEHEYSTAQQNFRCMVRVAPHDDGSIFCDCAKEPPASPPSPTTPAREEERPAIDDCFDGVCLHTDLDCISAPEGLCAAAGFEHATPHKQSALCVEWHESPPTTPAPRCEPIRSLAEFQRRYFPEHVQVMEEYGIDWEEAEAIIQRRTARSRPAAPHGAEPERQTAAILQHASRIAENLALHDYVYDLPTLCSVARSLIRDVQWLAALASSPARGPASVETCRCEEYWPCWSALDIKRPGLHHLPHCPLSTDPRDVAERSAPPGCPFMDVDTGKRCVMKAHHADHHDFGATDSRAGASVLAVDRSRSSTKSVAVADENEFRGAPETAPLARMLEKATVRLGILHGRMAGCQESGSGHVHTLSLWEIEGWIEEQNAALASLTEVKDG